jgi:hypothetical protein
MGERETHSEFSKKKFKERDHLEEEGAKGKEIIK